MAYYPARLALFDQCPPDAVQEKMAVVLGGIKEANRKIKNFQNEKRRNQEVKAHKTDADRVTFLTKELRKLTTPTSKK
ncbi:hypothetical protein BDZ45DRAFT_753178 [Acephala macrosclerotiorum]|nr:hypothetical protein BDZ45DRAFT_753178 [Acephala macrosclerotiorum]